MLLHLFLLEFRSLWRTRRMRQLLLLHAFMAIIFANNLILEVSKLWINVIAKAYIISVVAIVFAFFTFSKDSAFYQALLSRPLPWFRYVQAKYLAAAFMCFLCFLLVHTFDLLAGRSYWGFNFAVFTICAGLILPMMIYFAAYDQERIDTSRSAFFNYEGVAWGRQTLSTLPLLLFFIAPQFTTKWWFILLAVGGTAIALQKKIISKIAALLARRKYIMLDGFRQ